MAEILNSYSAKIAFFHSFNLGNTSDGITTAQAVTKSNHSIQGSDVKIDKIPFAANKAEADQNVINYPDIVKFYDKVILTEVSGSNKQGWYYSGSPDGKGTEYIDKWISPLDALNGFAQSPGYTVKLYDQNDNELKATQGAWLCNYNNGLIFIQSDHIPGLGEFKNVTLVKASFYVYVGKTVDNINSSLNSSLEWGNIN